MKKRFYIAEVTINNAIHNEYVIPFPINGEIKGITSSENYIHIGITYLDENPDKGLTLSKHVIMKVVKDGDTFNCQNVIFDQIIYTKKHGNLYIIIEMADSGNCLLEG